MNFVVIILVILVVIFFLFKRYIDKLYFKFFKKNTSSLSDSIEQQVKKYFELRREELYLEKEREKSFIKTQEAMKEKFDQVYLKTYEKLLKDKILQSAESHSPETKKYVEEIFQKLETQNKINN